MACFPSNSASCLLKKRTSGKNPNSFFRLLLLQHLKEASSSGTSARSLITSRKPELSADPSTFSWWASHVFPFTFALSSGRNFGDGRFDGNFPISGVSGKAEKNPMENGGKIVWKVTILLEIHPIFHWTMILGGRVDCIWFLDLCEKCSSFMQKWQVARLPRLTVLAALTLESFVAFALA